jgi:hypothetical protein
MSAREHPRLFLSYSHDSAEHDARVLALAERLVADGCACALDQFEPNPAEGWPQWMDRQLDVADYVLVVCTPGYYSKAKAGPDARSGRGVKFESVLLLNELYSAGMWNERFLPVLFAEVPENLILRSLRGYTRYRIDYPEDYGALLRHVTSHSRPRPAEQPDLPSVAQAVENRSAHGDESPPPAAGNKGTTGDDRALRAAYLRRVAQRVGLVNLSALMSAEIGPKESHEVGLEDVFVDGPTLFRLHFKRAKRPWLTIDGPSEGSPQPSRVATAVGEPAVGTRHYSPEDLGFNSADVHRIATIIEKDEEAPWEIDRGDRGVRLSAWDVITATPRLVILGQPGSGKSFLLRYLALKLASSSLGSIPARRLDHRLAWPHGTQLPIYIELRRFVQSEHYPQQGHPSAKHFWNFISAEMSADGLGDFAETARKALINGDAVLLIDGLDEVPFDRYALDERRQEIKCLVADICALYSPARVIITSRPYAYRRWMLPSFKCVARLAPFESADRIQMTERLYRATGYSTDDAASKAYELEGRLAALHQGYNDRPLFIALLAALFLRGRLPRGKAELYRQSIDLMLDRWLVIKQVEPRGGIRHEGTLADFIGISRNAITKESLVNKLSDLAFAIHSTADLPDSNACPDIPVTSIDEYMRPLTRFHRDVVIAYLNDTTGVLESTGQNLECEVFRFAHRSFQEYLAALRLLEICRRAGSFRLIGTLIAEKPSTWREPGRLVGDIVAASGEQLTNVWMFVDDLVNIGTLGAFARNDPRWWSIWLAAAICEDQLALTPPPTRTSEVAICNTLRTCILSLIETALRLPPVDRALCGRVLSLAGDPRPGVGLRPDGVPDIVWCDIPGRRRTKRKGRLRAFKMSKYPVTYKQFQAFVETLDAHTQNLYAHNRKMSQYFRYDNHPRDHSGGEAWQFCLWLSKRLGYLVTPPTEEEWERAAGGDDCRTYPWGEEADPTKGNFEDTGVGLTTAVGLFPGGASPYGVMDMCGNVFENTLVGDGREKSQRDEDVARGSNIQCRIREGTIAHRLVDEDGDSSNYCVGIRLVTRGQVIGPTSRLTISNGIISVVDGTPIAAEKSWARVRRPGRASSARQREGR